MGACSSKSDEKNILSNQTVINDIHKNIKDRFEQHSDVSNEKISNVQNISIIDEIPSNIWENDHFNKKINVHFTFLSE